MALPKVGRIGALGIVFFGDRCQASALLEELLARCNVFFCWTFLTFLKVNGHDFDVRNVERCEKHVIKSISV